MGKLAQLWNRLGGLFGQPVAVDAGTGESSSLAEPEDWLRGVFGCATAAGIHITPLSVLSLPTAYACVNAVSKTLGTLPLKMYRRRPDGGKDVADGHRLYHLLHDAPNDEMTSASFRRAVQANATLRNNGYAYIIRDGLGVVSEIFPIPPSEIDVSRDPFSKKLIYRVNGEVTPAERILSISGFTLDGITGHSPVSAGRDSVALAIALQDHGARFFTNATTPSAVIEIPHNFNDEKLKQFADAFDAVNTGGPNAHRRMFLNNGAKLANRTQVNHQQSQFLEARKYQDAAVCQLFGVPQIMAGILEQNHYATSEQEALNYAIHTITPWCVQWEQALSQKLLTERERGKYFFEFDLRGLLRADHVARANYHKIMFEGGFENRNEVRASENLNPVEGGDIFFVSSGVKRLDKSGIPVEDITKTETQSQTKETQTPTK